MLSLRANRSHLPSLSNIASRVCTQISNKEVDNGGGGGGTFTTAGVSLRVAVFVRDPLATTAAERRQRREILKSSVAIGTLALVICAASANASLVLTQGAGSGALPPGSVNLWNAIGSSNNGNNKAYIDGAGVPRVNGGNPGNGWWTNPSTARSWTAAWNNTAGTVTFRVFSTTDYTGPAAMTMVSTPVLTPGNGIVGINFVANMQNNSSGTWSIAFSGIEFDDGSGFVAVSTANGSYSALSGVTNRVNNYHNLTGTPGDFTIRGVTQMNWGTGAAVTSERLRFEVTAIQGLVPAPGAAAILGLGGLLAARRRR